MRIITLNVNGLRSALGRGLLPWLRRRRADVLCLQETRLGNGSLPVELRRLRSWSTHWDRAHRPGYSGVAVWLRERPLRVEQGLGWPELDREGRLLRVDLAELTVVSVYVPSGSSGDTRQAVKERYLTRLAEWLQRLRRQRRRLVVCGDLNVAHRPIDLKNWRANQKHSGFLPEERAWMDQLLGPLGFVDAFRVVDPRPERYTWWSNRGRAWEKNVGWRIDYQIVSSELADSVRTAEIYTRHRFSDHAPLCIDYAC